MLFAGAGARDVLVHAVGGARLGLPIVASSLGALPERLAGIRAPRPCRGTRRRPSGTRHCSRPRTSRPRAMRRPGARPWRRCDGSGALSRAVSRAAAAERRARARRYATRSRCPTSLPSGGGRRSRRRTLSLPQLYSPASNAGTGEARSELKRRVGVVAAQLERVSRDPRPRAGRSRAARRASSWSAQRQNLLMQVQAGEMQAHIGRQLQNQTSISTRRRRRAPAHRRARAVDGVADDGADPRGRASREDRCSPAVARRGPAFASCRAVRRSPARSSATRARRRSRSACGPR